MSMNAAFRRTRQFHFTKFLFQAAGVAGGELHPSNQNGGGGEIRFMDFDSRIFRIVKTDIASTTRFEVKEDEIPKKRKIPETGLCAVLNRETVWPAKPAINQGNI